MNSGEKLGKMIDLERELKDESTESKITRFGSRFADKSKNKVERNFRTRFNEKYEIRDEIN